MTTFVTVLAAAAVAFPLVVLALRGTRADLVRHRGERPARARDLGLPDPRDTDGVRAARDLQAAAAHRAAPAADLSPVERYLAGPSAGSGPIGTPGRSIHFTGSSSGTKPNLA